MELLVYAKNHWMDSWDAAKVSSLSTEVMKKYLARARSGDIVEVRPDGYWDKRGFDKSAFVVIKIPGEAVDKSIEGPLVTDKDGVSEISMKFKTKIDVTKLSVQDASKLSSDSVVDIAKEDYLLSVEAKK